jgi:hypothetical protein
LPLLLLASLLVCALFAAFLNSGLTLANIRSHCVVAWFAAITAAEIVTCALARLFIG